MLDLANATAENFQPHINELFSAPSDEQSYDFRLLEVTTRDPYEDIERIPFSLLFIGPEGLTFDQGAFPLSHPTLGELSIFMVPVGERDGAMLFESIFN